MRRFIASLILLSSSAFAADVLPTASRYPLAKVAAVPTTHLGALDVAALGVEDIKRDLAGLPPRFALPVKANVSPLKHGLWEAAGPEHQVWRYRVQATDAKSLNFGFSEFELPPGATLFVYSTDLTSKIRPFTHLDNDAHGQLWTPVVLTDDAVIELTVPNTALDQYKLTLSQIGNGYRGFGEKRLNAAQGKAFDATCDVSPVEADTHGWAGALLGPGGIKSAEKSGSCNMDTQCIAAPPSGPDQFSPWRETAKAVGVISTGGSTFCTGSLLNNTAGDKRMYFVTAAHCSITAGNAASLVVAWNFENSFCRVPGSAASGGAGDGSLAEFNTGSVHLTTNSASDFTLVELDDPANPAHDLHWAGWDKTPYAGAGGPGNGDFACSDDALCAAIHHPSTDEKRITFVEVNTTTTSYNNPTIPGNGTHVHARWSPTPPIFQISGGGNTGTSGNPPNVTEPGSSGSPLYNAQRRFIGQLHGGPSACGSTGDNLSDYYGRFSLSFIANSNAAAGYLDPTNSGVATIDGRGECVQPAMPTAVSATPNGNNRVDVSWGAVAGAESYKVFRALGACGSSGYVEIASNVVGTLYSDMNVSGGSIYSYRVTSYDSDQTCESVQSDCTQATATGTCTLAPTFAGVTSVDSSGTEACGLDVAWASASSSCGGPAPTYSVFRETTSGFVPSAANRVADCVATNAWHDPNVDYGTDYFYVVRAEDGSANGTGSCNSGIVDGNVVELEGSPNGVLTPTPFVETFEDADGFDIAGWTHSAISGANDWTWSTAQSQTATHSWNSVSLPAVSERVLVSPEVGVVSNTAMTFFHTYDFEGSTSTCYDGGTLEVSSDGGNVWTTVPDAAFTGGGFTGTINSAWSSPIAGKRAWCAGTIGPMTQVSVNLGAYDGQTIRLRWREGDDSSANDVGWFVDSVTMVNAGIAGACSTGPGSDIFEDGFED